VSEGASSQVCFYCLRIRLKKLPGRVNGMVVWLALNCWEDWLREAGHDFLDSGILHVEFLGGPECLSVLLMRKRFWTGVPKKMAVFIVGYSLVWYCLNNV
jgi:hypothetical protein